MVSSTLHPRTRPPRQFFTVWNFAALVAFFALGTGLSCSCCRDVAHIRERPPRTIHRHAAAAHHLLLAVELPMSAMITACVWLVLYPHVRDAPPCSPPRVWRTG